MTVILPGSAQIAAGDKRIGRSALRLWAGLWAVVVITGILAVLWPSGAVHLFALPATAWLIQGALMLAGIIWIVLLVDAWRISRPPDLAPRHRIGLVLITSAVIFALGAVIMGAASVLSVQRDVVQTVFAGGGDQVAKAGRYN
ncbi:MAG: LytR family transcriptional regulator, partial [Propionibacteriaceae bacterium]|nr:LytR family transcriptional regulator [Propionibacteriaceae bacterium]